MLVNYPNDGELPLGEAMLLYVPLHEAFHQICGHFLYSRPIWAEESLASYYGARAVKAALPKNPQLSSSLIDLFKKPSDTFQKGLLTINQAVKSKDRSEYGAFYTKGLSFWDEIESVLKEEHDSLDYHLEALLQMKYDANADPVELQKILNLTPELWASLRKRFLD